jgi:hypothetical protein
LERATPRPTAGLRAATQALTRAEGCDRQEVRERHAEAAATVESLRELRHANHFAERIRLSMEGGR